VKLCGNWGNPALESGADFGVIYFSIEDGNQGTLPSDRQLKFDSYNNSYISRASASFTLKHIAGANLDTVTVDDYNDENLPSDQDNSFGAGTWYSYEQPGGVVVDTSFVFFISDGSSVWAFAGADFEANGVNANNQGVFVFNVRKLQ